MNSFRSIPISIRLTVVILLLVAASIYPIVHNETHYGLDINGGVRAILQAEPKPGQSYVQQVVLHVLENRLNASGVAEPSIVPKGDRQFIVELPNIKNKDEIIAQLQATAQLEELYFADVSPGSPSEPDYNASARYIISENQQTHAVELLDKANNNQPVRDSWSIRQDLESLIANASQQQPGTSAVTFPASLAQYAPQGQSVYLSAADAEKLKSLGAEMDAWNSFYNLELSATGGKPLITGADIKPNAQATFGSGSNGVSQPVVEIEFTDSGTKAFGDWTTGHVNKMTGIILDGRILSAPYIESPITGGQCQIDGFSTIPEAKSLADNLNSGALPVPLSVQELTSVEATLGPAAVHRMELAGAVGLGLVIVFMLVYYLLPGLVADFALLFYALFTLAIFKGGLSWFIPQVTLTLPGIAGFILSVGMAVDANILIFERLKEELRNGKALRPAIDAGFKRAFTAIRDSNICTLITCTILYSLGEPSVKGFALTLGIGVVVSLFTAVFVSRTLLLLLVDLGLDKNPALFGLKRQWVTGSHASEYGPGTTRDAQASKTNIMGNRKIYYTISLLVIVPGIIFYFMGGLKPSIEFKGGTQVEVRFEKPESQEAIRHAILAAGFKDSLVQMAENGTIALISITDTDAGVPDQRAAAYLRVAGAPPPKGSTAPSGPNTHAGTALDPNPAIDSLGVTYTTVSHSLVGGTISKELTGNAFEAVVIAACLIVIYMAFAFSMGGFVAGLRFGTSAIVALLHDVLVLIGSFAILGYFLDWQIDSLFVTATLTVVGFSVHDTIVIFDRLRENLRHRLRSDSFEELANRSILQSFARSINTSFTVVLTLIAMLILGEPSTRLLNVALLIGIISGTYSSIFNATPILVDWENWLDKRRGGIGQASVETVAAEIGAEREPTTTNGKALGSGGTYVTFMEEDAQGSAGSHMVKTAVDTASGTNAAGRPQIGKSKKKATRRF